MQSLHKSGGFEAESNIDISQIVRTILLESKKQFAKLQNQKVSFRSTKLNLMSIIYKLRIQIARILVLYRWNQTHQLQILTGASSTRNYVGQSAKMSMLSALKYFRNLKPVIPAELVSSSDFGQKELKYSRSAIAVEIISDCISSHIKAEYSRGILDVRSDEFQLSIKISSKGKRKLRKFSVLWPQSIKANISPQFVVYLCHIIEHSPHVLFDAEMALHKLYLTGIFMLTYEQLLKIHSANAFLVVREENVLRLTFPRSFTPANELIVQITNSRVELMSRTPLAKPHDGVLTYPCEISFTREQFLSFAISGDEEYLESVIDVTRRYAFYTRLNRLWGFIVAGMSTITMKGFHATFEETCVSVYLFDEILCSVELDPVTGDPIVNEFGGMGTSPAAFLEAIQGCECQRNDVMRAIFTHALAKLIFESVLGRHSSFRFKYYHESVKNSTNALNFSFAPDFVILFGETEGKPMMSIHSKSTHKKIINKDIILLHEASDKDILDCVRSAAQHAKASTLMLQFRETLLQKSIPGALEQGKIHFFVEPFECIEFEIGDNWAWTLTFIKPVYVFKGNQIGCRFVDWVLNMVTEFASLTQIRRQVSGVCIMNSSISQIDAYDGKGFTITTKSDFATSITVQYNDVSLLYNTDAGRVAYGINLSRTPHMECYFGRSVEMDRTMRSLLRSQAFGAFLNGPFSALMKFHSVFMEGPNSHCWSVSHLCSDKSFFLIYKGQYSMNCTLRPSQIVQFIIPSVGKSALLQIPIRMMNDLPQAMVQLRVTMKLTMDQLEIYRDTVEELFSGILDNMELESNTGNDLVCYYPGSPSWAMIKCRLNGKALEFTVHGNREISLGLERFLRYDFGSRKIQSRVVTFVYRLVELGQSYVAFVVQILLRIISPAFMNKFCVDWMGTTVDVDKCITRINLGERWLEITSSSVLVTNLDRRIELHSIQEFDNWQNTI